MKWRNHLPDDCPPNDALPANGLVYRLADRTTIDERDFFSFRELYPDGEWKGVPECVACGLSIYTEIEGVQRLFRRIPAKRGKPIIVGNLIPQYGKIKNTPSRIHNSHHTWWIPNDEKPWEVFRVVELPEDK